MRPTAVAMLIAVAAPVFAQNDEADPKLVRRLVAEIDLVPSLYAKHHAPGEWKLPKMTAKTLAAYERDETPFAKEREQFEANKEKYAKLHPLRAGLFEAMAELEHAVKLPIRTKLAAPVTPKSKASFFNEQRPIGEAIFRLEQVLAALKAAEAQRDKEKSKRWQAHFDLTRTRIEADVLFLYEYNFTLGVIRTDALPELRPIETAWIIRFHPAIHVQEKTILRLETEMKNRLQRIQKEHAGTPWAAAAERESRRSFGMLWTPAKD